MTVSMAKICCVVLFASPQALSGSTSAQHSSSASRRVCRCVLVLPLSACGEAKSTTQQIFAMDTVMDLTAYGKKADDGINAAISIINSMDKLLDPENEHSKTYEINHAMGSPVVVNEQIAKMLRTAMTVYERSNGAFDLTTYPLSKLWGFIDQNYRVPSDAEIERLLPCVDMSKVQLSATDDSANSLVTMPADMALSCVSA